MSDTREHRSAAPFPTAGDPRTDAPPEGVANFARYRFYRELARVSAELRATEALSDAEITRALDGGALARAKTGHARWKADRAPHLRLVS